MSGSYAREGLINQLEAELRSYASLIHLSTLGRAQGTQGLIQFLRSWARSRSLFCELEVNLGATRVLRSGYLYRGYLDIVIDRWLAIEVDSGNKRWSLTKLEDAQRRGYVPVWIRWRSPQKLHVPSSVRLILLSTP